MYSRASSKIRVYTISDQDDSGPWIRKTFPGLFYIVSPGPHGGGAYHFATWSGASGDRFHGRFVGADFSLVDNPWPDENIRRKYFAARMDWTIKPYAQANHPPVPKLGHARALTGTPGQRVDLSAEGSTDPDGDALSYEWFYYPEPGTLATAGRGAGGFLDIRNFDQPRAWFVVPTSRVMAPGTGTMHIILAVTDHGTPRLTRYERVIVTVVP